MALSAPTHSFDPTTFETFRFLACDLSEDGRATLRYALDERIEFVETFDLPLSRPVKQADGATVQALLSLLHWVAGVSYFKTAAPPTVACDSGALPMATGGLLEALYSEGL